MDQLTKKQQGRIAGLFYFIVVLTGIFSLAYVPAKLFEWDNPAATFNNIVSNELLFRWSIASSVICYTAFIFLPVALYKILSPVNPFYAKLMVILAIVSVPISFANLQNKFSILTLIGNDAFLKVYSTNQLQSEVMLYLNQYDHGILVASVFWGLWLLPFGYLVYKSGLIPKFFGVLLMLGCLGYLINFMGNTILKNYGALGIAQFVSLPASLGEIGTCIWLLIMGARERLPSKSS